MCLVLKESGGLQHLSLAEQAGEMLHAFAIVVTTEVTPNSVHCIIFSFAYSSLTYISQNQLCWKAPLPIILTKEGLEGSYICSSAGKSQGVLISPYLRCTVKLLG